MAFASTLTGTAFVLSRALFAVVIGYLALGNLLDLESSVGYAKHKGAPLPTISVARFFLSAPLVVCHFPKWRSQAGISSRPVPRPVWQYAWTSNGKTPLFGRGPRVRPCTGW